MLAEKVHISQQKNAFQSTENRVYILIYMHRFNFYLDILYFHNRIPVLESLCSKTYFAKTFMHTIKIVAIIIIYQ